MSARVRWRVLVNEAAGSMPLSIRAIKDALDTAGVDHDIEVPVSVQEMRAAVAIYAARGGTHLALAGGDGTVNLAVNVLMTMPREQRPIVGVLPGGTGCDLLRTFAIPHVLGEAATHLKGDQTYQIDVGRLDGSWGRRYFVNAAQAGVGGAAAQTAEGMSRRWGRARYPIAFLARLPGFPGGAVEIDLGQRHHAGKAIAVIFANGQFFAGGWNVAPRATLMDGRLDLQVNNCAKWEAARLVPKIVRGVHLTDKAVRRYSTAGFDLLTELVWPIEADGEVVGNTPVVVSVEPGALSLKI
ncbi:MAG: diacylglycerol kinase family protein [Acidimicrobiia bacterium]|nr:diacylglycerol kinase family protein [Acidimicrobiia bacterium]